MRNGPPVTTCEPASPKNASAATQTPIAGAARLKSIAARRSFRALHAERQHQAVDRGSHRARGRTDEQGSGGAEGVRNRKADWHGRHAQREQSGKHSERGQDDKCGRRRLREDLPSRIRHDEQTGADDADDQRRRTTGSRVLLCVVHGLCDVSCKRVHPVLARFAAYRAPFLSGSDRYKLRGGVPIIRPAHRWHSPPASGRDLKPANAYGAGITIPNFDVSRDGQRFIMVRPVHRPAKEESHHGIMRPLCD